MKLENIIKFERIREETHLFEKVTLLSFLSICVFISKKKGRHLGISIGFFAFEIELTFRSWLVAS
jgi:hypoxanthine-guanine phosphoribosyltransferase|tara:strand:+ start:273 stop:467 length:195 start_codon:yes stop_codon:yes gene_type:complete